MNSFLRTLIFSTILATLGWISYPNYPEFNYIRPKEVAGDYSKHTLIFDLTVHSLSDGFFQVIPDDCLFSLKINSQPFTSLPVPYCDIHVGRFLDLSEYLRHGVNRIEVEIFNTQNFGNISFIGALSPWKVLLSTLLWSVAVLNLAFKGISKLPHFLSPAVFAVMRNIMLVIGLILFTYNLLVTTLYSNESLSGDVWMLLLIGLLVLFCWALPYCPQQRSSFTGIPQSGIVRIVMLMSAAAYSVYASLGTISLHNNLYTRAYDLGIQENIFWNILQGDFYYTSVMANIHYLGNHTSLIYLIIFPLYYMIPRTETLLVIQTLLVAGASIFLYYYASLKFRSYTAGLLFGISFLLHPLIQGANFYDFHELAFSPILIFASMLFYTLGRRALMWGCIILLLCVKEDASIMVACLGAGLCLMGNVRFGLQLLCIGGLAYNFFQGTMIPAFSGESRSYAHYFDENFPNVRSPYDLVMTVAPDPIKHMWHLMNVERALYLLQAFGPFLAAPLWSLPGIIFCSYGLFLALYGGNSALYIQGFQYAFHFVALIYVATIITLSSLVKNHQLRIFRIPYAQLCLFGSFMLFIGYGMVYPAVMFKGGFHTFKGYSEIFKPSEENKLLKQFAENDAPVLASERIVPHLAQRPRIQTIRYVSGGALHSFEHFLILSRDEREFLDMVKKHNLKVTKVQSEGEVQWYQLVKTR